MKKLFLLIFASSLAIAHPGKIDEFGGHTDTESGTYHFHVGPLSGEVYNTKVEALRAAGFKMPVISGNAIVSDGDTIKVDGRTIRIYGIDAPEKRQTCVVRDEDWSCGMTATDRMVQLTENQEIVCEEVNVDRYGRSVAICKNEKEQDIAKEMVSSGLAVAYVSYSNMYVEDEFFAKQAGIGIWAGSFDMPWDWRKANK